MNAVSPALALLGQSDMGIPIAELIQTVSAASADEALLSLRGEFRAAVTEMAKINRSDGVSDEDLDQVVSRFDGACTAIVDSPPAQTRAGRALKAAAAKQQMRGEFNLEVEGEWPSRQHELVWHFLSEIAGDEYFPSIEARFEPPSRASAPCEWS